MTTAVSPAERGPDEVLLAFTRALRAAGVPVTQDRAQGFLAAAAVLGVDDQRSAYLAGRASRNRSSKRLFSTASTSVSWLAASTARRCRICRGKSQS